MLAKFSKQAGLVNRKRVAIYKAEERFQVVFTVLDQLVSDDEAAGRKIGFIEKINSIVCEPDGPNRLLKLIVI